jgi:hypothetical protein
MNMKKSFVLCHKDGSVSYWSLWAKCYLSHVKYISTGDMVNLPLEQQLKIIKHFEKHNPTYKWVTC